MKIFLYLFLLLVQVGLFANDLTSIKNVDEAKFNIDAWKKNPYFDATKYKSDFQSPLHERIGIAPDFVLETMGGWDEKTYKSYALSKDELHLMKEYLNLLPPLFQKVLKESLIGIYFVEENFLGSGFAEMCFDENYHAKTFLIINKKTLNLSLSEWLTQKELTCFIDDQKLNMEVQVEVSDDYLGLYGILLHEAAHCVDYVHRITPYLDGNNYLFHLIYNYPVKAPEFSSIWKSDRLYNLHKVNFPLSSKVTFYGMNKGPKLKLTQAKKLYQQLEQTPFCSAYASLLRPEDFAESAMYYHLTQHLNLPYKIKVLKKEKLFHQYEPFKNPHIKERLQFLEKLMYE